MKRKAGKWIVESRSFLDEGYQRSVFEERTVYQEGQNKFFIIVMKNKKYLTEENGNYYYKNDIKTVKKNLVTLQNSLKGY